MIKFIENLLLNETIIFNGTISDFKSSIELKKDLKFNLEWISDNTFKALSKSSVGTAMIKYNANAFDGIKIYGELIKIDDTKSQVKLSTKVRGEIYFMGIAALIFPFIFLFSKENFPYWLFLLFPIITVWFWFVYQFQEKLLLKKVIHFIKNK